MPQDKVEKISQYPPLDQDICTKNYFIFTVIVFIAGEREMPLSVYESPLMNAYRRFKQTTPDEKADGYYVVNRQAITNTNNHSSNVVENDTDVILLYGRGPVFHMNNEYADRFEGFDD